MREVERHGVRVRTGIWKFPVDGRIRVEGVNVAGDEEADLTVHGGYDKAVYAYAAEDYDWWGVPHASFGENLTVQGLDVTRAVIGEHWRIGTVETMARFGLGDHSLAPELLSAPQVSAAWHDWAGKYA